MQGYPLLFNLLDAMIKVTYFNENILMCNILYYAYFMSAWFLSRAVFPYLKKTKFDNRLIETNAVPFK